MPSYVYAGPGERVYPEDRDASGVHLGAVTPGDIRIFDDPPADGWWVPEIPPRDGEADRGGIESDPDPADVRNGTGDGGPAGPHDDTPPGPVPAAPAVIPGE